MIDFHFKSNYTANIIYLFSYPIFSSTKHIYFSHENPTAHKRALLDVPVKRIEKIAQQHPTMLFFNTLPVVSKPPCLHTT